MSIFYRTIPAIIVLFFLLIINGCKDKNTPKIATEGMFMHDPQHSSHYESFSVKKQPELFWKVKTGGQVISSPVAVDNVVYIGSGDTNLYAIDAVSGDVKWTFETGGPVHSTPLAAQGKVLFLSYDGFFYAVDQKKGDLIWKFETEGESIVKMKDYFTGEFQPDFWDFYLSSAVADNKNVYFGSSDANVYALDIETGNETWKYKTGGSIHSSPALSNNSLVIGSWDSRVYCLNTETGKKNWSYTTGRATAQYIWLGIQASPSIDEGMAYIGSANGRLYGIDLADGEMKWEYETQGSLTDTIGFFDKEGKINIERARELSKGIGDMPTLTKLYTKIFKQSGSVLSSPAIDDQAVYFGSCDGYIYTVIDKN